jgi:hypothetical protein
MIRLGCRERLSNSCPKSVSEKTSIQMITLIALSRLTPMKANQTTKKKGTTMNPLIQFKIRILPLLIAPALVTLTALTAAPALATPNCGVTTSNLLYPGQPVDTAHAAHFPDRLLDLMCRDLPTWLLHTTVHGDSDVYVIQNTFPPGAHSGWHTHPGPSLITVTSGALTVYEASNPTCTPIIYTAGQSFTKSARAKINAASI